MQSMDTNHINIRNKFGVGFSENSNILKLLLSPVGFTKCLGVHVPLRAPRKKAMYISYINQNRPTIRTDCTTPLFYVLAPTCFGRSLPSSGSLLNPCCELLEIQIGWVVCHIMCGYVNYCRNM
jgi:hypothetical protein